MTVLGTVLLPQLPPERLRDLAVAADEAGLEELWLWEDCFREGGLTSSAAALAWTTRLRVGIGILPIPLRNVAVTAMEIAALERMFPGRFHAGVGSGVQDWMGQVGARAASPLGLMREYLPALRSLLAGDELSTTGDYITLDRVKLDWPPAGPIPILVGTGGPKALALSGEFADGTILSGGTTPDGVRQARIHIDEGRARAGRMDEHRITVYVMAATGRGAEARWEAECRNWDLEPSADVGIAGDAAAVAAAVQRWADAGADTVVLQPTADEPDHEGFIRFVAREVRPLVSST
jgi:alkanesulfonate monooxygenase SsuD/methylene tetrahydromethanopterin reductase-like flavin-dependent oxidoreductase (luciferase family)